MEWLDFIFGIIAILAGVITVIGVVGLRWDCVGKDKRIQELESQLAELRKRNMEKARKEREEKKKLEEKTKGKAKTKKANRSNRRA